jgi:hypothetical protein
VQPVHPKILLLELYTRPGNSQLLYWNLLSRSAHKEESDGTSFTEGKSRSVAE